MPRVRRGGALLPAQALRRALEEKAFFDQAFQFLSDTPLVAPVYYTLSGPVAQGAVVQRGRQRGDARWLSIFLCCLAARND